MRSEAPGFEQSAVIAADGPAVFDWTTRAQGLSERMDGPLTFADWLAASRDIARVNFWTRAYAPTIAFLERVVALRGVGYKPLHIVDAGCGHGDVLRRVARWASQRSVAVRLTGIDQNPYAARAARLCGREERVAANMIEWTTADVFAAELDAPPDVVISSLFTHHLRDANVIRFLEWSEAQAQCGWMINDLRRSERAYSVFGWAARLAQLHPLVVEDGLVSLRRAFTADDWKELLSAAHITGADVVEHGTRLCVERLKKQQRRVTAL